MLGGGAESKQKGVAGDVAREGSRKERGVWMRAPGEEARAVVMGGLGKMTGGET